MDFSNFWFFPSSISALETARLGEAPIPADGCHGDVESFGGFFLAQSAEETHLHDPAFSRIDFLELSQGLVQRQHVGALWYGHTGGFDEGHLYRFAAALKTIATARAVHEHPPHHVGGHAEKVGAVRPLDVLPVHQAEIRFVDQRSWLQLMSRGLLRHVMRGKAMEFLSHFRHQRVESVARKRFLAAAGSTPAAAIVLGSLRIRTSVSTQIESGGKRWFPRDADRQVREDSVFLEMLISKSGKTVFSLRC